jgi:hypothetical protein
LDRDDVAISRMNNSTFRIRLNLDYTKRAGH